MADNPLVDDRTLGFLLDEVLDLEGHLALPAFAAHDRDGVEVLLGVMRRLARRVLFPTYKPQDEAPPTLVGGRVHLHPSFRAGWDAVVESGFLAATRPVEHGGAGLPYVVQVAAAAYLGAGNPNVVGLCMLTTGAAHLVEAFGDDAQRAAFMTPLYEGRSTGTMALTEPQAGSSLGDVQTTARPAADGSHRLRGSKIFISGGDHDLTDNVVHLVLARIVAPDGHAVPGTRGLSLFVVPRLRQEGDRLVDNDVTVTQVIHKIGWRGLPSLGLSFGDRDDCHGWLVGPPGRGMPQMFQMMNEARIGVGVAAVATASVAYHAALDYARTRPQGRPPASRDQGAQVPLLAHADVRRMLLRQKAIVEGGLCLALYAARLVDQAEHHPEPEARTRAQRLLDLLTPVVKTFPAEWGYESVTLALQIHGGYGYSSELPIEAWLRDQKLNSIHEGTTGIQGLDLLGRKAVAHAGEGLRVLLAEIGGAVADATAAGVDPALGAALEQAAQRLASTTLTLGQRGLGGDVDGMLLHSHDYLVATSVVVVALAHLLMATAATRGLGRGGDAAFYEGKLRAARYFSATELPRVAQLCDLCERAEDSYAAVPDGAW